MSYNNNATFIGRFTRDADIRHVQVDDGEATYANFTLAVDRRGKDAGADFIRCTASGKRAEWVEKWTHKGMKIAVQGHIQTGSYTNKDGQTVYTTDVIVDNMGFVESKAASAASSGQQEDTRPAPEKDAASDGFTDIPGDGWSDSDFSDALPFD